MSFKMCWKYEELPLAYFNVGGEYLQNLPDTGYCCVTGLDEVAAYVHRDVELYLWMTSECGI